MSLFVTVVTRDLIYVFLCSVVTNLRPVDSGGRGGIPLAFVLFLLLVCPGLIGRLGILGGSRHGSLSLGFVPTIIFHCSLSLDLVSGIVGRSISSGDLLIGLSYVGTRL